ncbi:MAG: tRNA uridine(34) 5-carboxymethylaminomethyl modification radical SAM/GNAT enzyme Elp3 [Chloroflexi bacterium]|nr:tRNA uridine(34) 5-carboxymethylaminomethyl modification radical SAM/GNAT enzyme Elp3 [Chloroflexota bacterium]
MPRHTYTPRATGITPERRAQWLARHTTPLDLDEEANHIHAYIEALLAVDNWDRQASYDHLVRQMGREGRPTYSKAVLRRAYLRLVDAGALPHNPVVLSRLRTRPVRTASGIVPISVMVEPAPCPGKCIFCPTDTRMPKSYLSNEPAGQRALTLQFDPYAQTRQRIMALQAIGHTVDKVELIVLGGTWSSYPRDYQTWFVRRMFDALNDSESASLEEAHMRNETARHRSTGLVIETRPDCITVEEIRHLRRLGVTRVQIGLQSTDDGILSLNKRGHTVEEVRRAVRMLRGAGFKITLHWMPNLFGATPESDRADFARLWSDPGLRPDELKIYPTGLLRGTELYALYEKGHYQPYSEEALTRLLADCLAQVPEYCRVNRVMRDIPAPEIVEGTRTSNLRQIVEQRLNEQGRPSRDIRSREVRYQQVDDVTIQRLDYTTDHSREVFLSAVTPGDRLAAFLRLSLPDGESVLAELANTALIRQVQVYGPTRAIGADAGGAAQHQGLGTTLINQALAAAGAAGYASAAVIAAVGTRPYYRRFGFETEGLYMVRRA